MKKILLPVAIASVMLLSAFTFSIIAHWKISDGYSVKFSSKDPSGVFKSMKGDLVFDENDLAGSRFSVTIDVASISTGNFLMNILAKSGSWFDVDHYPTIKFVSTEISRTATGYETTGILELHGVRKQITIPFNFKSNTFMGSFIINRLDYKVGNADGMNAHASTNLLIEISVPVQKQGV